MTPAERARLYRERRREGRLPVTVDLTREQIDLLIDLGYLAEWDDADKAAIAQALDRYLRRGQMVILTP